MKPTRRPTNARQETGRTRVLLVDDHPLMRRGLRAIIDQHPRFEVCGEAQNAPEAIDLARRLEPALGLVDISLHSTNGIELTKGLRAQAPQMRILVISMYDEELFAERALRAGALGYLMKHEATERVLVAMERVMGGEIYVSDRLKERLLHRLLPQRTTEVVSLVDTLSDREMEVLQLIGSGFSTRAIAEQLHLSVKTIDSYREHLKLKLKLRNGADLLRYAIQWMKTQPAA